MKFTKMHGLGNDYLYVYGCIPDNPGQLSVKLSDRHFGAGSDGMIYILPSDKADFKMRIFNADGSEAKMCGNGIRCVGKYVYDKGYTDKTEITVETLSGIKRLLLTVSDSCVSSVTVDMGKGIVSDDVCVCADGHDIKLTPVSMGNPHAVSFCSDSPGDMPEVLGSKIENNALFPGGVNVEFAAVCDRTHIRMRVWERGSGVTLACGTGACATVCAAISRGLCDFDTPVEVRLDGGTLTITVDGDYNVTMTGSAEFVYEGEYPCLNRMKTTKI